MQENTNWYWEQKKYQQFIIIPTKTIVHTCLDVVSVQYVHGIPRSIRNRNQAKQYLQRHHLRLTDSYPDYILEEVEHRYKIEYKLNIRDDDDEK